MLNIATLRYCKIDNRIDKTVNREGVAIAVVRSITPNGDLLDFISEEMKKLPRNYLLPAGVVLAGGGANLDGLVNFTKNRLKLAVRTGGEYFIDGLSDRISDPAFAVAVGMVLWGFEKEFSGSKMPMSARLSSFDGLQKVSKWFKNFMP